ncbi:hypothetical protein E5J99_18865 [Hymenobacter elongatus]|uniref:Uncharacterized protein n=2 Tax=Hymenobacter elongatus TaxID=877208 RepID=A0A4Z0PFC7_9BACT|nr:hypothetical protein E5J99_18865 [Hymenobacter elongatus]
MPLAPAPTPDQLMFPEALTVLPAEAAPTEKNVDPDAWVPFGSYVHRSTYLQLKQAEFWEPGFEIREFVEAALQQALAQMPAAQKELPTNILEKLRKTNRKLG